MFDKLRSIAARAISSKPVETKAVDPFTALVSPTSLNGSPPRRGTRELLEAYSEMPWLRATTNKVGRSISTIQWKLWTQRSNGRAIDPVRMKNADYSNRKKLLANTEGMSEIFDHPLLELLRKGNDTFVGQTLLHVTQVQLDLTGESFWLLERSGAGKPVALWALPPHWIKEFPTAERRSYRVGIGNAGDTEIPVSEIIPFIDVDPLNPYGRGTGIAKSLGDELDTDEYAAKHLKSFFYNKARPDLIISGQDLSREDTVRIEERWTEKHQGFWQSFKPHFLNRKIDVVQLGQSFENMQMIDLRKHERDTIIQVFGAPPEKFGVLNNSNRSTIISSQLFWNQDILLPRLEFMRCVLQQDLVPLFDPRLVIDFELPEIKDEDHVLNVMRASPWAFTQNEWRAAAGHEPISDGDIYSVSPGTIFTDDLLSVGEEEEPEEPEDPEDPDEDEEIDEEEESVSERVTQAVISRSEEIEDKVVSILQASLKDLKSKD
jgi:hypothetical protein